MSELTNAQNRPEGSIQIAQVISDVATEQLERIQLFVPRYANKSPKEQLTRALAARVPGTVIFMAARFSSEQGVFRDDSRRKFLHFLGVSSEPNGYKETLGRVPLSDDHRAARITSLVTEYESCPVISDIIKLPYKNSRWAAPVAEVFSFGEGNPTALTPNQLDAQDAPSIDKSFKVPCFADIFDQAVKTQGLGLVVGRSR